MSITDERKREINRKASKKYKELHKERVIESNKITKSRPSYLINQWEKDLIRDYGIQVGDYNRLFIEQSGRCAVCGIHQSELKKRLCVDHDHKTGKVRGLLCTRCNIILGFVHDDPNLLVCLSEYLLKYKEN